MLSSDLDLAAAWKMLEENDRAVLIDVRTEGEWQNIGIPDLSSLSNDVRFVQWILAPDGRANASFLEDAAAGLDADQPLLMLCRSGARSHAAGVALAASGFTEVHNVSAGFEGPVGPSGQHEGGWKSHLPWTTP